MHSLFRLGPVSIFISVVLFAYAVNAMSAEMSEVIAEVSRATVRITVQTPRPASEFKGSESKAVPAKTVERDISGVIVGANGTIVTVAHAVERATKITVRTVDGREFPAVVQNESKYFNIALLKVDGGGFPIAKSGDLDGIRVADRVYAVSILRVPYPIVVDGIVSFYIPRKTGRPGAIQTTMDLPPELEGSGLFDQHGKLIGINFVVNSKASQRRMSVAVPIDDALDAIRTTERDKLEGLKTVP